MTGFEWYFAIWAILGAISNFAIAGNGGMWLKDRTLIWGAIGAAVYVVLMIIFATPFTWFGWILLAWYIFHGAFYALMGGRGGFYENGAISFTYGVGYVIAAILIFTVGVTAG